MKIIGRQFMGRTLNSNTMMYEAPEKISYPVEMMQETMEPFGVWKFLEWKDRLAKNYQQEGKNEK
jgi:hypothetical protein